MRWNARTEPIRGESALDLLDGIRHLYVTKGTKVVHCDFEVNRPAAADLLRLLLGPTGNLRAPTVRRGSALIVGFDEATYRKILGP